MGDCHIRQRVLCKKDFGWMALWGLNPDVLGSLCLMASATWGGMTSAEGLHDWGGQAVPISIITLTFALQLRKRTENLSQGSQVVGDYSLRRLGCLKMDSLGRLVEHQCTSVTRGWLQSALGRHRCLPSCRTKGFPASANFESKLSVSALMWSAKNGIPKLWYGHASSVCLKARSEDRR
jgi:hypothetical protein